MAAWCGDKAFEPTFKYIGLMEAAEIYLIEYYKLAPLL
jgi:hypothetical protein